MRYPFDNWQKFGRGFKFKQIYPKGFGRLSGNPHLGVDVMTPTGTPLYAPCDGTATKVIGSEIGNAIYFKTENNLVRFLHLSKYVKLGAVKEGELIGYTGNTGLSTGPHCHVDVSKGLVFSTNIKNFIDPDVFFYPPEPLPPPTPSMKLRCPLQKNYLFNGKTCVIIQLFGGMQNPEWGKHTGIDLNTVGDVKYRRDDKGWLKDERTEYEKQGRIPIVASHAGKTTLRLNEDKQKQGWGIYVTADPMFENGEEVQYRTLYWHIETPWSSLQAFWGAVKTTVAPTVGRGQIIAIAGDNGLSKGPHLHFELQKRTNKGMWTEWESIDPIPYFEDREVLWQFYQMTTSQWFYQGKEVTRAQVDEIKKTLLPVV